MVQKSKRGVQRLVNWDREDNKENGKACILGKSTKKTVGRGKDRYIDGIRCLDCGGDLWIGAGSSEQVLAKDGNDVPNLLLWLNG